MTLFVVTLIAASARMIIRIHVQKSLSLDDAFLLFGVACLICAIGLFFTFVDKMYLTEATITNFKDVEYPPNFLMQMEDFQKWVAVCLILLWCSICSVKFSFLFLFRKLVDRVHWLTVYWWWLTIFCVLVWIYGAIAYILPCPWYYSVKSCRFRLRLWLAMTDRA